MYHESKKTTHKEENMFLLILSCGSKIPLLCKNYVLMYSWKNYLRIISLASVNSYSKANIDTIVKIITLHPLFRRCALWVLSCFSHYKKKSLACSFSLHIQYSTSLSCNRLYIIYIVSKGKGLPLFFVR